MLAINEPADDVVDRSVRQCGHVSWIQEVAGQAAAKVEEAA